MRPFSARICNRTVEYLAASWPTTPRGNAKPVYPDTGVMLAASVQPDTYNTRDTADGNVLSVSGMNVYLRDDPSSLNGGLGVRERDQFRDNGHLYAVINSPQQPGHTNSCWLVECREVT